MVEHFVRIAVAGLAGGRIRIALCRKLSVPAEIVFLDPLGMTDAAIHRRSPLHKESPDWHAESIQ